MRLNIERVNVAKALEDESALSLEELVMERRKLNSLIPELLCSDFETSLNFYTGVLGFSILYQREEGFAMLERQEVQIMLDQNRPDNWVSAKLENPYGRGINLQIKTTDIQSLYSSVQEARATVFLPIEDKWYRADDVYLGCRQFIVLDPDGYMLRFLEDIGIKNV